MRAIGYTAAVMLEAAGMALWAGHEALERAGGFCLAGSHLLYRKIKRSEKSK